MQILQKSKHSFLFLIVMTLVAIGLMLAAYSYVTQNARTQNFSILENASATEAKLLRTKLEESTKTLDIFADAVAREADYTDSQRFASRVKTIQERTIFEGVDMILADGTVLFNSGKIGRLPAGYSFDSLQNESHMMTSRRPGIVNKDKYYVRYITPVIRQGQTVALIVGSINCSRLPDYFQPDAYNGQVIFSIVDAKNGLLLMDNWHRPLGNLYDLDKNHIFSDGNKLKTLHEEIGQLKTGVMEFTSKKNGETTYLYYRPLHFYSWMLLLGVQEKLLFANLFDVKRILWLCGCFILCFFGWNALMIRRLDTANARLAAELEKSRGLESSLQQASMSGLASGNIVVKSENFDVRQTLKDCFAILGKQLQAAQITYNVQENDLRHYKLYGKELLLQQILLNIISNAVKYNKPQGFIDLTVREVSCENGQAVLEFKVKDTGIGMSEEFIKHNLFQPLMRKASDERMEFNGTGLGMAIVQQLVERLQGNLSIKSRKGFGTRVVLTLPFALAQAEQKKVSEH